MSTAAAGWRGAGLVSPTPGRLCVSTERIYVAEPLFQPFVRAFVARTEAIRLGNAPDFEHDMGSLINHGQLARVQCPCRGRQGEGCHSR